MQCSWLIFDLAEMVVAYMADMANYSFDDSWCRKEQFDTNFVQIGAFQHFYPDARVLESLLTSQTKHLIKLVLINVLFLLSKEQFHTLLDIIQTF